MNDPVLIFVHVPKAGGTTLHTILARQYAPAATYRLDIQHPGELQRFLELPPEARARIRCLRGHLPFGLHTQLPRPPHYITLLRDPVERFLSQYRHCLRAPENAARLGFPPERSRSLEAYLDLEIERRGLNFQTRFLCGAFDRTHPEAPYPPLPADALARACDHLDRHILLAGPVDRFDEFLVLAQRLLGWRRLAYLRRNVDPDRGNGEAPDPRPETLARIRALHAADEALVAHARARFDRLVAAQGPDFTRAVLGLRRWDALACRAQRAYNTAPIRRLRALARTGLRSMSHRHA